jgi:predicted helicase
MRSATMLALSQRMLDRAIATYYDEIAELRGQGVSRESGLRRAFERLLVTCGKEVGWTLIAEDPMPNRKRPDAALRNEFHLYMGYWEAKDPDDNLEDEIRKKIALGYPLTNIIFENGRQAILFQDAKRADAIDLSDRAHLAGLLKQFFEYAEPTFERFDQAVAEFKGQIPELAHGLLALIGAQRDQKNARFLAAYAQFREVCRSAIDPDIRDEQIDEMLVQHLLTERLFRTVFDNQDFTRRNVIAQEIEKVIDALVSQAFSRDQFQRRLDRFYKAIEEAAKEAERRDADDGFRAKQEFMNIVYERFFQGFAVKEADTHGIVYTPQAIVDFMCASVEEVLRREFGTSLSARGVQILDPCTGTGNFIVNLLRRIAATDLEYKYQHDLFANEIMLLPYYIASMNIEHAYFARAGRYQPFEGICFVDTLSLARGPQMQMFTERNTERVEREKDAQIMVIVGNPPYNVGQQNENDNNKNRRYPDLERRVRDTYARDSQATNKNALSDAYVKFFRWATDRLNGRDGVVCFVSNDSFVDQIAFDGMRQHLLQDFTQIWHLDLGGNAREREGGNVFGIMVGVGITIAIRASQNPARGLWYFRVPEDWRKEDKLGFLAEKKSMAGIQWQELEPDERHTWLTEGMRPEFATYLPMGSKQAKSARAVDVQTIFRTYSGGVKTNRDDWVYDFNRDALAEKIKRFISTYNSEVDRWRREGGKGVNVDDFVLADDTRIKWSRDLKLDLQRGNYASFDESKVRHALYRPFCKQWLFLDRVLNEEVYQQPDFFPTPATESENCVICVPGPGNRKEFGTLISRYLPSLDLAFEKTQCFPLYTYDESGGNRQENVTAWALERFQASYGPGISKRDIFHYVYALLHHPQYRERYAENLKRELPRIPLVRDAAAFRALAEAGARLAAIHTGYERWEPFPLAQTVLAEPLNWRVEKMSLSRDRASLTVNPTLRLDGIPTACFDYRLGNRSALDWVIDQYQASTDKRSGITTDPNRADDPHYIVRLVGQVIAVSLETCRIVAALPELPQPPTVGL